MGAAPRRVHVLRPMGTDATGDRYAGRVEQGDDEVIIVIPNHHSEDSFHQLSQTASILESLGDARIVYPELVSLFGVSCALIPQDRGRVLDALIEEGQLPVRPALALAADIAGSLHVAYHGSSDSKGAPRIAHGSLNPGVIAVNGE